MRLRVSVFRWANYRNFGLRRRRGLIGKGEGPAELGMAEGSRARRIQLFQKQFVLSCAHMDGSLDNFGQPLDGWLILQAIDFASFGRLGRLGRLLSYYRKREDRDWLNQATHGHVVESEPRGEGLELKRRCQSGCLHSAYTAREVSVYGVSLKNKSQ